MNSAATVDELHEFFAAKFRESRGREPTIAEDLELRACAQEAARDGYRVKPEEK